MRYCILEHRLIGSTHWDLLLEQPSWGLRTWKLLRRPPSPGWAPACALPPHHPRYLVYQGPVLSAGGFVRRWDEGTFRLAWDEPDAVRVLLNGKRLTGLMELRRVGESDRQWRYRFQLALGA